MGRSSWTATIACAGAALFAVFLVLGFSTVSTAQGPCGTGLWSGWSNDMLTGTACETAANERNHAMAGVPGFLLLGVAGVGTAMRARNRGDHPSIAGARCRAAPACRTSIAIQLDKNDGRRPSSYGHVHGGSDVPKRRPARRFRRSEASRVAKDTGFEPARALTQPGSQVVGSRPFAEMLSRLLANSWRRGERF